MASYKLHLGRAADTSVGSTPLCLHLIQITGSNACLYLHAQARVAC